MRGLAGQSGRQDRRSPRRSLLANPTRNRRRWGALHEDADPTSYTPVAEWQEQMLWRRPTGAMVEQRVGGTTESASLWRDVSPIGDVFPEEIASTASIGVRLYDAMGVRMPKVPRRGFRALDPIVPFRVKVSRIKIRCRECLARANTLACAVAPKAMSAPSSSSDSPDGHGGPAGIPDCIREHLPAELAWLPCELVYAADPGAYVLSVSAAVSQLDDELGAILSQHGVGLPVSPGWQRRADEAWYSLQRAHELQAAAWGHVERLRSGLPPSSSSDGAEGPPPTSPLADGPSEVTVDEILARAAEDMSDTDDSYVLPVTCDGELVLDEGAEERPEGDPGEPQDARERPLWALWVFTRGADGVGPGAPSVAAGVGDGDRRGRRRRRSKGEDRDGAAGGAGAGAAT